MSLGDASGARTGDEVSDVAAAQWHDAVAGALTAGYRWLCLITAWDASCQTATRGAGRRRGSSDPGAGMEGPRPDMVVSCRLENWRTGRARRLETRIAWDGGYRLSSVRDLVAGAAWYEREIADQFGIVLDGGVPGHLVIRPGRSGTPAAPLRRSVPLPARAPGPPGGRERRGGS